MEKINKSSNNSDFYNKIGIRPDDPENLAFGVNRDVVPTVNVQHQH